MWKLSHYHGWYEYTPHFSGFQTPVTSKPFPFVSSPPSQIYYVIVLGISTYPRLFILSTRSVSLILDPHDHSICWGYSMKPLGKDTDGFKTVFCPILSPAVYAKGNVLFLFCDLGLGDLLRYLCLLSILSTDPNSGIGEYAFP